MRFFIKAVANGNKFVTLNLEAANANEAVNQTHAQGLSVLTISEHKSAFGPLFKKSVKFNLELFSQELLSLIDAGISLIEALETLCEKENRPDAKRILTQVITYLKDGQPLSSAMQKLPEAFPALYAATVRASERTGSLAEGLGRYITYASQLDTVKKKLVSASIYPLLLIFFGGLVMMFLLGYIVPKFARIYDDLGGDLPLLSRLLLQWGKFVESHGYLLMLGVASTAALILHFLIQPSFRKSLVDQLWKIPAVGERLRIYQLARFYRTLGMLLRGGIPIITALDMVGGLLQLSLKPRLTSAINRIMEGTNISTAFSEADLTSPVALRMLRVGERSGQMGEMMERIAVFYDEEIARWVEWFTKLFEPILMAFIGIIIGGIVVLMYLPIFELASGLQ